MTTALSRGSPFVGRAPTAAATSSTVLILRRKVPSITLARFASVGKKREPALGRPRDGLLIPQRCVFPVVDVFENAGDPLIECDLGPPAEFTADLGDVRPRAIRLARAPWNESSSPT